ncbi:MULTISPECIES: GNAT family N-acetyltransferase [Planococcus]|nr:MULTISPECIES: GNAT family N-acetyltransferase [Planococcus]MDJ0332918.1 GNAT family N-acetyltransferase [Planococcus sp. S3-L1]
MPYIQTSRLTLITFTVAMMKAAISNKADLEKITTYRVADGYPMTAYKEIIPYKIKQFSEYPHENKWEGILVHNQTRTIIGDMGFRYRDGKQDELELGYSIVPSYQGHGYATEMAQALVAWGKTQSGINRIIASCDYDNFASIRVLEKAGLRRVEKKDSKIYWST